MSRCGNQCHNNNFNCGCNNACRNNCNQRLVRDCVCVDWSVPHGRSQTIYQNSGFRQIFASGFINFDSFDNDSSDSVVVRFFLRNIQVGSSIRIFEDSSVAFSFTRFDQITVECPPSNVNLLDPCEGEICINTRVPVG